MFFFIQEVLEFAASGKTRPMIGQILPLAEAAQAHASIEARKTVGKTLVISKLPSVS